MNSPLPDFTIKIAGRIMEVHARYETTRSFCEAYLCRREPDFTAEITAADINFEREECARLGVCGVQFSDSDLEIIALLRKTFEMLLEYDTLLFHGSVIAVDGAAYLFTAPSGTGKSTHTRLWRELLGSRAVMVNDDKPFLKMTETGVLACGSPWNGKHRLGTNICVPLKAICILERGAENSIRQISARDALMALLAQSGRPRAGLQMPRYMDLLDRLASGVTFYRLACNMEPEAAQVAYEAMSGSTME